jgi:hypothetical protein
MGDGSKMLSPILYFFYCDGRCTLAGLRLNIMAGPIPLKINIQSPIRDLRVDHFDQYNCWRIWLTANGDFTLGTFIQLNNNSTVQRITWHPDGTESIFDITNK